LQADLGHILNASGVGAEIQLADLPASSHLLQLDEAERYELQLTGGDDYDLCFNIPFHRVSVLVLIMDLTAVPLSVIGRINNSNQLIFKNLKGEVYQLAGKAYEHFTSSDGGGK
jgi:thiamine-monophosphate kinase